MGLTILVALLAYSYWKSTQTGKSIVVELCSIVCFCFAPLVDVKGHDDDDAELDSLLEELEMRERRAFANEEIKNIYQEDPISR